MEKAQWTEKSRGLEEAIGTSQPGFIHTKYTVHPKIVLHGFIGIAKDSTRRLIALKNKVWFCLGCYERIKKRSWRLEFVKWLCFLAFFFKLEVNGKSGSRNLKDPMVRFLGRLSLHSWRVKRLN
jgi:hypothetical protein